MRHISVAAAILTLSSLIARPAEADWLYRFAELTCDEKGETAVLTFDEIYNQFRSSTLSGDCTLANGLRLHFETGAAPAMPYGECGAAPDHWFSLWVDGRRVFFERAYAGCRGQHLDSVRVSSTLIEICRPDDDAPPNRKGNPVRCDPYADPRIVGFPDWQKFLPSGHDPADSPKLMYAEHPPTCQTILRPTWQNEVTVFTESENKFPYSIRRGEFDVLNRGKPSIVYLVESRTGSFDGDLLYVFNDRDPFSNSWREIATTGLGYAGGPLHDFADVAMTGEDTVLRRRYTYFGVIRIDDTTYIRLDPIVEKTGGMAAIRGNPDGTFTTVCVWQNNDLR